MLYINIYTYLLISSVLSGPHQLQLQLQKAGHESSGSVEGLELREYPQTPCIDLSNRDVQTVLLHKLKVSPNRVAGVIVHCILLVRQIANHRRRDDSHTLGCWRLLEIVRPQTPYLLTGWGGGRWARSCSLELESQKLWRLRCSRRRIQMECEELCLGVLGSLLGLVCLGFPSIPPIRIP